MGNSSRIMNINSKVKSLQEKDYTLQLVGSEGCDTAKPAMKTIGSFSWEIFAHTPYSLDLLRSTNICLAALHF